MQTGNLQNLRHCLLVAPHAGPIERHTKEILLAVAKLGQWAYYVFEGRLKTNNYRRLHITSTGFNEPKLLQLLERTNFVLSFHGASRPCPVIYVGGLHEEGRNELIINLNRKLLGIGLAAVDATLESRNEEIAGRSQQNVTNRGLLGRGIQLEFAQTARTALFDGQEGVGNLKVVASCIHVTLRHLIGKRRR